MNKTFLVIALLIAATTPAFAQTAARIPEQNNSVEQAVLKVTQEWLAADERHDRAALNRIIADDFLGTAPMGNTVSKRDIIPREGTEAEAHGLSINGQDIKVRVFGDTAIVTGRGVPKTPERAERGELRFTVVFVKRAESWQMVAAHLSPVPRE
jgi:ketosteroid isomerase-like protein